MPTEAAWPQMFFPEGRRVPLAPPVSCRSVKSIRHWQSQWHTICTPFHHVPTAAFFAFWPDGDPAGPYRAVGRTGRRISLFTTKPARRGGLLQRDRFVLLDLAFRFGRLDDKGVA